ncbi:MAG TPA: VCBS repeat-containing protein [Polyangiaceae bacterium]|nr:VCBS repeat-containing protein [Polyangiaceae bacterium]
MFKPLLAAGSATLLFVLSPLACSSAKSAAPISPEPAGASGSAGAAVAAAITAGSASTSAGAPTSAAGSGTGGAPSASAGSSNDRGRAGADAGNNAGSAGTNGAGAPGAMWSSAFPTFTKHTIASFNSGYAVVAADIDRDGLQDVVALSSGSAGLVWFKNPSWTKYTITTTAKQLIFMTPYDVDGDGDVDLAFVSDFDMNDTNSGGTISWAEAPGDATKSQEWALHAIDAIPTSHRLRWADIDGDGKKELIVLPLFGKGSSGTAHAGAVQLKAYFIPADPKAGTWTSKVLDDQNLEVAHGLEVVDWDGDKADDLLTAANDGVELFHPAHGAGPVHLGAGKDGQAPNKGSSEVALGRLGAARFFATIEPWHGTDAVIYTPGSTDSELWNRKVLGSPFEHGHGLAAGDFNGDGFDEVVGGGGQGKLAQYIFRYVPSSGAWDQIELDIGGVAVSGIDVKDIDGDGALDIVSIGGSPTNNVVWYENSR